MKKSISLICLLAFICINSKPVTSSDLNNKKEQTDKIPEFKELFKNETYRMNSNQSSECTYTGKDRLVKCKKISQMDEDAYDKALNETRALLLERLKLDEVPEVSDLMRSFYDEASNNFDDFGKNSGKQATNSDIQETRYDKQTTQAQVYKSLHEAKSKSKF
jgi:hypothetical protein